MTNLGTWAENGIHIGAFDPGGNGGDGGWTPADNGKRTCPTCCIPICRCSAPTPSSITVDLTELPDCLDCDHTWPDSIVMTKRTGAGNQGCEGNPADPNNFDDCDVTLGGGASYWWQSDTDCSAFELSGNPCMWSMRAELTLASANGTTLDGNFPVGDNSPGCWRIRLRCKELQTPGSYPCSNGTQYRIDFASAKLLGAYNAEVDGGASSRCTEMPDDEPFRVFVS